MSRNKRWWMASLVPSTGSGNIPLILVLVRHLQSCFFLADKFPSTTFWFSLQWINIFPDPSACSAGSVSGVCIPEDESANTGTNYPVGPSYL